MDKIQHHVIQVRRSWVIEEPGLFLHALTMLAKCEGGNYGRR
jgi:hypothetical protein